MLVLQGSPEERALTSWFYGWEGSPEDTRHDPGHTLGKSRDQTGSPLPFYPVLLPWTGLTEE